MSDNQQKTSASSIFKSPWAAIPAALGFLGVWLLLYRAAKPASIWISTSFLQLPQTSPWNRALQFFLYDTTKIFLLLLLMIYGIGWLRAGLHTDAVRDYLDGKKRSWGYLLGAGFGAITPFCSCSSIPLFIGFTTARIPLGVTLAFLITSPLVNEVAVVLLWGLLGWQFTLLYIALALGAGILGGFFMDSIRAQRWLQPYLLESIQKNSSMRFLSGKNKRISLSQRHNFALSETRAILGRIWIWVLVGVGVGAFVHGFVPEDWFAAHLGAGQWWSVPLSVLLGIPLYTNATGIVPVMESLLIKGLPVGTTLAFCMSTVAVSLPEILLLGRVMRWQLLVIFVLTLLILFTGSGWVLNMLPFAHFAAGS